MKIEIKPTADETVIEVSEDISVAEVAALHQAVLDPLQAGTVTRVVTDACGSCDTAGAQLMLGLRAAGAEVSVGEAVRDALAAIGIGEEEPDE